MIGQVNGRHRYSFQQHMINRKFAPKNSTGGNGSNNFAFYFVVIIIGILLLIALF